MFVVVRTTRVSTRSVVGEEMSPPWFDPIPTEQIAVGDGSSFLPIPLVHETLLSGRFKTRTSRWWFKLLQLQVHLTLVLFFHFHMNI